MKGLYLLVFQEFPPSYYTKSQINKHIGEDMATVGGDLFQNKEQELPLEQTYFESDVDNWEALRDHGTGSRGMKRVVVTQDFTHAYYTSTHYGDFTEILFNV